MSNFGTPQRVTLSADATRAGLESMQKLSRLGAERNTPAFKGLPQSIDLTAIDSAFRLSSDPQTIRHLVKNGPAIIKGCIRFMRAAIARDSSITFSPSFECSYNCFRLLVVTLNLCLLDKCNELDGVLKAYKKFTHYSMHTVISVALSQMIETQAKISGAGGDCDSIFGWSPSTSRVRRAPLITQDDTLALLNLLWDFRKGLLKAMLSTSPPGLSGLMFLFLRSVINRPLLRAQDWELTKCKLHELALRYMLIGYPEEHWNQHDVMGEILDQIDSSDGVWSMQPKYADAEDSRCILQAFIDVISCHTQKSFPMNTPYILYRLVVLSVDYGSQDLLAEVMEWSINYAWSFIIRVQGRADMNPFVQGFFRSFMMFLHPPHDTPYEIIDPTQEQIITAFYRADLLDLVARVIAELKPGPRISSPLFEQNEETLQVMLRFFAALEMVVPEEETADLFQNYILDWWKFNHYLQINATGLIRIQPGTEPHAHRKHYEICGEIWLSISDSLGPKSVIEAHPAPRLCDNHRCPTLFAYNHVHQGSRYGCANCDRDRVYCNNSCQVIDWRLNKEHQEVCSGSDEHATILQ